MKQKLLKLRVVIGFQLLGVVVLGYVLVMVLASVLQTASGEDGYGATPAEGVSWCESAVQNRDYAGLLDRLTLFDLYGPEFSGYWELAEGYQQLVLCMQNSAGEAVGLAGASERRAAAHDQLRQIAEAATDSRNVRLLAGFLEQADALAAQDSGPDGVPAA